MIVIADQLFCERLKDIFQVHALRRYTMRRTSEWLELAHTYNCDLLKKSIYNFLCANLCEVLESRVLEDVHLDYLTELDERYREMFPEIKYRQVVPSHSIDEEFIETFAKNVVLDMSVGQNQPASSTPNAKSQKETKNVLRTTADFEKEGKLSLQLKEDLGPKSEESPVKSECNLASILSEDASRTLQEIEVQNMSIWKMVGDKKPEPKRTVIRNLNSNEVLLNEPKMCGDFSNLSLKVTTPRSTAEESPGSSAAETTPKCSPFVQFGDFFSPTTSNRSMSQKQRRRNNSSRQSESEGNGDLTHSYRAPESVWNIPSNNIGSPQTLLSPPDLGKVRSSGKKVERAKNKPQEARAINFDAILVEEREEKLYLDKLKSKSLNLTQLEEAAIGELLQFYNVGQVFDEDIVITRKVRQQVSKNFSQWPENCASLDYVAGGGGIPPSD